MKEQVVVGGSIQKQVSKFLDRHRPELLERRLGLYLCCMHDQEAENEFKTAYPEVLRNHTITSKIVSGEFRFDKMHFIEKALVKKIAGVHESVSKIDEGKIRELVEELSKE